ncbi:MAG: hypothetical protein FWF81_14255 [Defluviitaleaceae bacterium]|nr:hypothetical protein [Defluviitaleaceae bacterium]
MNIRTMARNELLSAGFNPRSSFAPPAWQGSNAPNRLENAPASNASIRNAGNAIQSAFSNIHGRQTGLNAMEGRTSDADVATVRVDASRTIASMPLSNTTIDVRQEATAQVNEGTALSARGRDVLSGTSRFEIEVDGRTHTFNINVGANDDNTAIQRRMATAINNADIGVRAAVTTEGTGASATSTLTLTGRETGEGNSFTVRDADGANNNLAFATGINTVTSEAQNARFSINGGPERTSQSNEVEISRGITATIQGEGRAEFSFARNSQQLISAATDLVNSINSALRNTNPSDGRGSERFASDIIGMNITFGPSLARAGINVEASGQLSIDSARMQRAAEDGSLARLFENRNSGFAGRAERIANNAASGSYRNAPAPINFTSPQNHFNFGNAENMWSMMNLFM